jgi:uncharacterized damage-inducible protein DinB
MNKDDISTLYAYNDWANARVLRMAAQVSPQQYLVPADVPQGSLRSTLVHILAAEVAWRQRWQGDSPTALIAEHDLPTFEALHACWQAEAAVLRDYLASLSDDNLAGVVNYKTTRGTPMSDVLWQLMAHVVNHGTQHRSEAAVLLTRYGHSPGDLDLIMFLRESR